MTGGFDLAVVGGGVLGSAAALRCAQGGMKVVVLDKGELGGGASGVNAGTLSLQIKRVKLMPYALRGHALWKAAGEKVGYHEPGGLTLAFNDREAALLEERMALKREAGAPIELIGLDRLRALEPGLSRQVVAASWCAADGFADSSLTGAYYRGRLKAAGVEAREHAPVSAIRREGDGFELEVRPGAGVVPLRARRLLLACGAWSVQAGRMIGLDLPVRARVNTVSATERGPRVVSAVIGHATGLLTLKQKPNGSVLIGGGWQGQGTPDEGRGHVRAETLIPNLQLACHAVPRLKDFRLVRTWTGFEANTPDFYPLAGPAPGVPGAWILACVRGGYTIGPYMGGLMGDAILGRDPELPLFDPARFLDAPHAETSPT